MMPQIDTVIVGTKYRGDSAIGAIAQMRPGDGVRLERELDNKHDANAIRCHFLGLWVGYVPTITNPRIAGALDSGQALNVIVLQPPTLTPDRKKIRLEPKIRVAWEDGR